MFQQLGRQKDWIMKFEVVGNYINIEIVEADKQGCKALNKINFLWQIDLLDGVLSKLIKVAILGPVIN